ncbi:MAG TPA: ABC transporter ATP-binding protein, partial [Blastocatellia bacterium]|nr:ABC transporter ATP-binding protein [Blastocatellia bacterium]
FSQDRPAKPMIAARNLTRQFNSNTAVEGLTFEVLKGEVVGLLGPNGAGKTTTVRMLSCLIAPTAGEAAICGYRVGMQNDKIRRLIGVLTEVPGLYENLTARRNVEFYAELHGVKSPAISVQKYLSLLGLWERRDERVSGFSKGMKQKLAIARALVHEPKVLFLDEPTSGLDPEMTRVVRDFIDQLHQEGRTILICTHNLDEAERLCDRVAVIRSRLVAMDRPSALRSRLFGRQVEVRIGNLDERLASAIRNLSFVRGVSVENSSLVVSLDDPINQNPVLVRELVRAGGDVVFIKEREHSLEDVYLELIAREERR